MQFHHRFLHRLKRPAAALLCLILACAWLLPLGVGAQESTKTVRVGWYESPFNSTDSLGRRSGYAYDYQQKIAAYTNWSFEYVEGSWPELLQLLIDGELDLMSDVSFTEERAEHMLFPSMPMGSEEYYFFVSRGNTDFVPNSYSWFQGKRVGVNKDSVQVEFLKNWQRKYGFRTDVIELSCSEAESFRMLLDGELDAFVTLDTYGNRYDCIPAAKIGSSDFYFAVNKERPDLLQDLNAAMERIQDENRFYQQQLFEKHVNTSGANIFLSWEEKTWLTRHGAIRVGYQDGYLPFCAADEDTGELTGALKEYLENAADCLGNAQPDFTPAAYPSAAAALEALKNGEVDCIFPSNLSTYDGEIQGVMMTPPIMQTEAYILVPKAEQSAFFGREQVTVSVETGDVNCRAVLMDMFPEWKLWEYPDTEACLRAVADGETDCYLTSNYRYNSLVKQCQRYELTPLSAGKAADFCFAVNNGSIELYSILTRITGIVSKASVNAALTYYSAREAETGLLDMLRENLGFVIGVLLLFLLLVAVIWAQARAIRAERAAAEKQRQIADLNKRVFVDALTSVRNKGAFDNYVQELQARLELGELAEFAIGIFDCDDLKLINDRYGHDRGDEYLKTATRRICETFRHSPVFRIGGDEFAAVLQNEDYQRREELTRQLEQPDAAAQEPPQLSAQEPQEPPKISPQEQPQNSPQEPQKQPQLSAQEPQEPPKISVKEPWKRPHISVGVAAYDPELDASVADTIRRADERMYENKRRRKEAE